MAGDRGVVGRFDDLASELRMVIGLIGRLYDDPHEIARTHEPLLAAIEAGHPERITAHVDYHIGHAWREVGKLVRELTPPSGNVVAPQSGILIPTNGVTT